MANRLVNIATIIDVVTYSPPLLLIDPDDELSSSAETALPPLTAYNGS